MPSTRYSLIARLGDPADAAAWSEFLDLYESAIRLYSRQKGLQDSDANDAVQQVLLLVHRKIGQWKPSRKPGAFRRWLLQISHRICLETFRTAIRVDRATGGTGWIAKLNSIGERSADNLEEVERRQWALCWASGVVEREVDPVAWRAFVMNAIEGVAAVDVAKELGLSTGGVYLAKCRILSRRRVVGKELSEAES
jgi:RNA polymerase sigma-70 factor (ECF subfamily)